MDGKLYDRTMLRTAIFFNSIVTGIVTLCSALRIAAWAYEVRGYFAVGGEVVLVVLVMALLPWALWEVEDRWVL